MKRYDPRLWLGILLVLGGILALLDTLGVISNAGGIFWGLIWGAAGLVFLYMLINNRENWWAAFPAFTLLGLALTSIFSEFLGEYDSLVSSAESALLFGSFTLPTVSAGGRLFLLEYCSHWVLSLSWTLCLEYKAVAACS